MAQLVERLLPTHEICGSNPVIDNFYYLYRKTKIRKEAGNGPFNKQTYDVTRVNDEQLY